MSSTEDADDVLLVEQTLSGKQSAFAELVRRYQAQIRSFCYSWLRNRSDADDAAQEVFLRAYRSLSQFQRDSKLSTWLFRIARNYCIDLHRKAKRKPKTSLDAIREQIGEKADILLKSSLDQGAALEAREITEQLLSTLPEQQREAILLREAEGLSYKEIADVTGRSIDGVKALLRRARRELQKNLRHILQVKDVGSLGDSK